MYIKCLVTVFIAMLAGFGALDNAISQQKSKTIKGFDTAKVKAHIEQIMKKIPTSPGLAVAVVRGDKVIFIEGFGYRNIEKKLTVNKQTRFYLASATKSFTAATAKILDDEGKIDMDGR